MRAALRQMTGSDKSEGQLTEMIEEQTARLPSATFLTVALGSMALSWIFLLSGRKNIANFIGQWAPTLLILGLYNKLVKLEGHD